MGVVGQTVIEVLPEPSARQGYEVLVNGRPERLTRNQPIEVRNITGEVIAEVVPEPEKAIKVKFLSLNTGIFVYVYGEEVKVEVPPTFKARTTGICGNNNGEKFDELMTGLKKVKSSKIQKDIQDGDKKKLNNQDGVKKTQLFAHGANKKSTNSLKDSKLNNNLSIN